MGQEGERSRWTWGDWVLLALPLLSLPVVADRVGDLPASDRAGAWAGFAAAAAAGLAIGSVFVRKLRREGVPSDPAERARNRRRNTILAFVFGGLSIVFSATVGGSVEVVAMGAAFGLLLVVMIGYAVHVARGRDATERTRSAG